MWETSEKDEELDAISLQASSNSRRIHSLSHLFACTGKRYFLRSSLRNTLARLAVALKWREE